jgi:hypothetical protein
MINEHQAEYKELLEELRHRYRQKYDTVLDDEILYLVIRLNELQFDLKKEIKAIPKITFKKGIDYFWYGVGKTVSFLMFGVGLIVIAVLLFDSLESKKAPLLFKKETLRVREEKSPKRDTSLPLMYKKGSTK